MFKQVQLYDDQLDFEDNKAKGPFGDYQNVKKHSENQDNPKYDFFGVPVFSPFGIAAGPLPTTRFIEAALALGYDIVTLKSVRTDHFPVNPYPQVRPVSLKGDYKPDKQSQVRLAENYSQPLAVTNSFGIPSVTPAQWQPVMRDCLALPQLGQALLAAFQGTARGEGQTAFIEDHVKGVGLIRKTGANIVEINLSCPNEGHTILTCFDTDITERIVKAVRAAYPDLIFTIKLAYFADKEQLKDLVSRIGGLVDGISAINTIPVAVVNTQGQTVFPGRATAGLSGSPIKWAGIEMTKYLQQYRSDFGYHYKILSMGGVLSAEDFHDYLSAGADYVFSVSGAMWNPYLAQEIKASL